MLQHFSKPRFELDSSGHTRPHEQRAQRPAGLGALRGNAVFLLVMDDCGKLRRAGNPTPNYIRTEANERDSKGL